MNPVGVESDASGKDQADVWSEGDDSKPVNAEAGCAENANENEELYVFPQCTPAPASAAAPKRRAKLPSSLTLAATSKGRAASPAPLTTGNVSSGRTTPVTFPSVNKGLGLPRSKARGFLVVQATAVRTWIVFPTKMHNRVRCRLREGRRPAKLYLHLCWGQAQVESRRSNRDRERSNAWGCSPFANTSWRSSRSPGNGSVGCV